MCRFQRLGCGHLWEVTILPTTQRRAFQAAEEHVKALRSEQDGYDGGREGRAMWVHIMLWVCLRKAGRAQIIEHSVGHGMKTKLWSCHRRRLLEVLSREWHDLIYIFKRWFGLLCENKPWRGKGRCREKNWEASTGDSLAVQCLKPGTLTVVGPVSIPSRGIQGLTN